MRQQIAPSCSGSNKSLSSYTSNPLSWTLVFSSDFFDQHNHPCELGGLVWRLSWSIMNEPIVQVDRPISFTCWVKTSQPKRKTCQLENRPHMFEVQILPEFLMDWNKEVSVPQINGCNLFPRTGAILNFILRNQFSSLRFTTTHPGLPTRNSLVWKPREEWFFYTFYGRLVI